MLLMPFQIVFPTFSSNFHLLPRRLSLQMAQIRIKIAGHSCDALYISEGLVRIIISVVLLIMYIIIQ